jgi:hypothetical protein
LENSAIIQATSQKPKREEKIKKPNKEEHKYKEKEKHKRARNGEASKRYKEGNREKHWINLNAKMLRGKTGLGLDISHTSAELNNRKRENWTTQKKEKGGHTKKGRTTKFTN